MKKVSYVVLAAALACAACGGRGGPPGGMMQGGFAFPVSAAPLTKGTIAQTFSVTASVNPLQSAQLSSVVSGTILLVGAQIGQHVSKGQLLVKIDDSTLQAQLQSTQASLDAARSHLAQTQASSSGDVASTNAQLLSAQAANTTAQLNLHRNQELLKKGFVAQSAVDQAWAGAMSAAAQLRSAQVANQNAQMNPSSRSVAQANLRSAQAAVDQSQAQVALTAAQIAQTEIRAPFDGVVVARNVDPGSLAAPGTPVMEVAQLDPVFVDVDLAGENLKYVKVGTPVAVSVSGGSPRVWHGTVAYLNQSAVPGTLTYKARVPVANPDAALRGGMVANVAIEQARKKGVLLAPRAAVFQTDTGFAMFIIDKGPHAACPPHVTACAKSVPVTVGLQNDQQMEVAGAGLAPGTQAILNHAATLQPGMPVQALPPQAAQHY